MKIKRSDLIIRYDISRDCVLLCVPKSANNLEELKLFNEIPLSEEVTVKGFSKEIGIAVASFLHARHSSRFKVVEATSEGGTEDEDEENNSKFDEAHLLMGQLNASSKVDDIEAIDLLLKQASQEGDEEASKFLNDTWSDLRDIFVRRLSRGWNTNTE
jgi:hypothetical protein